MFQKSIIEKYLSKLDANLLHEKYEKYCANYKNETKIANIRTVKEEQYQEGFIRDVFCSVLNYTIKPEPDYNILTELKNETKNKNNARKSDGAICEENNESRVRAVIELKGTDTTDLDTVARQAFDYKSHHENCNYAIVCNFERLRLYVETQIEFIEFNLFTLTFEDFCILYLLLELNQLKNDIPLKIKHETLSEEKQITDNFYADYSTFKRSLFEDMIEKNPQTDKLVLFKKTQKILDRILFILFCEDRGLLPANSVMGIIGDYQKLKEMGYSQPLYSVFKTYFDRIDKGYKSESDSTKNIFAYNGGLFKPDETLDNLTVGDDVLFIHSKRLADYDFESQISVDILGRIFENSLTEIEEVQKEIEAEKSGEKVEINNIGKRKKDGVFYTPEYITKYIVENTIGKRCEQQRAKLNISDEEVAKAQTKKQKDTLNAALHEYQKWLFSLKILDPACGSGAFLTAALTQLKAEHRRVFDFLHAINNDSMMFEEYSDNSILENNLYGVDINEESVEITKLSLWLHTAQKDRKLTTLNNKIKCGNSLIDDSAIAGEKAFKWEEEFPEVFGGNRRGLHKGLKSLVQSTLSTVNDIEKGDVIYHVTTATHNSRYSEKALFFNDGAIGKPVNLDFDEEIFVMQTIAKIIAENKYKVLAYNFCKDHLHFLVACKKEELPKIMQKIKGITSLERNRKFNPTDRQLWQQKYFEKVVYNDEYLENTIHYILNNRKKHGLKEFTDDDGGNSRDKEQTDNGKGLKSLGKGENKHGFDVVIGNPPYVNMVNILNENERKFYQEHYKTVKNKSDLYSIFTEKAHLLLKKNGLFGFIFSNSWMGTDSFTAFREFLAKDVTVTGLTELPEKVFKDATVKTCICFYTNNKPTENNVINIEKCENARFSSKGFVLPYKQILENDKYNFSFEKTIVLNKIKTIPLKDIVSFSLGIKTSDDKRFIFNEKKDDDCYLFLRGRNIQRWGKPTNNEYLWYRPDLITQKPGGRPRVFENFTVDKKIVIQDMAVRINATIDKEKFLCNDKVNIIYAIKNEYSMEYILSLLNSKLINKWFKKLYSSGLEIKINQLETIPIPEISLEAQQPFITLADKMLILNETLQKKSTNFLKVVKQTFALEKISTKLETFYNLDFDGFMKELKQKLTPKTKLEWLEVFEETKKSLQEIQNQIAATDKEINALVYKLYDLTEEEIKIVEGR
ncbi:MAG: N-6 DNA methylase [Treponema sp.]|nr:N-6 DNA methylase [Spirochaetales bacterium]MDY6188871.1 N-6 DNA methylase [Treponema sp.]